MEEDAVTVANYELKLVASLVEEDAVAVASSPLTLVAGGSLDGGSLLTPPSRPAHATSALDRAFYALATCALTRS